MFNLRSSTFFTTIKPTQTNQNSRWANITPRNGQITQRWSLQRSFSLSKEEQKKTVDEITEEYFKSKELIEDARESLGTTYFSEDFLEAERSMNRLKQDYSNFLQKLDERDKKEITLKLGMRMEEIKAQFEDLKVNAIS
eukprot:TRINITY_DN14965_c0_g1_i1.p1 TRINITY_DN14965_c0_g1~~TRINITY_DN14965_c0_g1_i1.p1  ORF type:complete len:148 (-),score=30.28 TRINITY_DN14965_c0_g1_i1:85-501(-)